ncbi:MAG: corrinoid protein [Deltaproteobacteria bacterium]|nr:corrinoid protein [Deltaproteobacteria bacterium]
MATIMTEDQTTAALIDRLREQIVAIDHTGVQETTQAALDAGVSAQRIIAEGLGPGMEAVGKKFEEGDYFVPELLLSARAMGQALDLLRPHLEHSEGASPGVVVLGTVQGDVHEIGKNIVSIVLSADGFEVHDLGEDVPPQDFVNKARELGADVVGMSALISIAVSQMAETVSLLKESDFAGRVIVGGAAVTRESADGIGADAFAADAWGALRQVRALARGTEA